MDKITINLHFSAPDPALPPSRRRCRCRRPPATGIETICFPPCRKHGISRQSRDPCPTGKALNLEATLKTLMLNHLGFSGFGENEPKPMPEGNLMGITGCIDADGTVIVTSEAWLQVD